MNDKLKNSLQASDLLVSNLRELAGKANNEGNTALWLLVMDMIAEAQKIRTRLGQL